MAKINKAVIEQFRAGGPIEGMHRERLLLLSTTGRRSGLTRTAPMMFHLDGATPVVIASNMGSAEHPEWFRNLVADPRVRVEIGSRAYEARAEVLDGPEYHRVWLDVTEGNPFFLDHQAKTSRRIPLVRLSEI